MSDTEIRALNFEVDEVGKHVKGSKKRYAWTFELSGKKHKMVLDSSMLSGKVKLELDNKILIDAELSVGVAFQHPFTLEGFSLNVLQQGDNYEFRLNNKVFSHLYNQEKTKSSFQREEDCVQDIKVDTSNFAAQSKIKINIGGSGMKKKSMAAVAQSDNWNDLAGNQQFPNYFGDQGSEQVQQPKVQQNQNTGDLLEMNQAQNQEFNTMQNMFSTSVPTGSRP